MYRKWSVRWRWQDGPEEDRTHEQTFDSYHLAAVKIGRVIESPRPLEWITGPTEQEV